MRHRFSRIFQALPRRLFHFHCQSLGRLDQAQDLFYSFDDRIFGQTRQNLDPICKFKYFTHFDFLLADHFLKP